MARNLAATISTLLCVSVRLATGVQTLFLVCSDSNDLARLLTSQPQPFTVRVAPNVSSALDDAEHGDSLMILAEGYPLEGTFVSASDYVSMSGADLAGAYIEMPVNLPGDAVTSYVPSVAEYFHRVVMYTDAAAPWGLRSMDLLQAQGAYFMDYPVEFAASAEAGFAHVVGSYNATLGLPPFDELNPVLFSAALSPGGPNASFGAIKLSSPVSFRYTPHKRWCNLLNFLVAQVTGLGTSYVGIPDWNELVHPTHSLANARTLSATDMKTAIRRATDWMGMSSGLLVTGDEAQCPAPHAGPDAGDIACMLEGFQSKMEWNGSQAIASDIRVDCTAESAMAFAFRALLDIDNGNSSESPNPATTDDPPPLDFALSASRLLNYTWLYSDASAWAQTDAAFGLVRWGLAPEDWTVCTYGDDNARVLLGSMLAASALRASPYAADAPAFDHAALISLLANLRIASVDGFRPGRINFDDIERTGWQAYASSGAGYANTSSPQPHYQAQMWAAWLLAWARTGFEPFYVRAASGIAGTMAAGYPSAWRWTEYISEERGRLLLAAAWLVRADVARGTPVHAHISWLEQLTADLLESQDSLSGGVQERLGTPGLCDACPPASNAAYGSSEAPLIQDPAIDTTTTDQLYGNNYYIVSLFEAAAALRLAGSPVSATAAAGAWRLAQFLAAIQAQSSAFPRISGAWLRAFDLRWWTYWGSAADSGWGPWSVETGWSTTWAVAGLAMVARNTTLWDWQAAAGSSMTPQLLAEVCPLLFTPAQCTSQLL
jgi:hypothetical protein